MILSDLSSSKGTFVNGVQVREKQLQAGDLVQLGEGPTYRLEQGRLSLVSLAQGMSLRLANVGRRLQEYHWLLRDVSVTIESGSFVGIIGPSGSGKSVLIECLAALAFADDGEMYFDDGHSVHADLDLFRQDVAYVPQDDLIYPLLTVLENMKFAAAIRISGIAAVDQHTRVAETMKSMQLSQHADKSAGSLSGGQRKRLSIAMELVRHPRLLILDEPTSGLDSGLQVEVMDVLRSLSRRGTTVICSTHTLDTLNYLDQVIAIGKSDGVGMLAFDGSPSELLSSMNARNPAELYRRLEDLDSHITDGAASRNSETLESEVMAVEKPSPEANSSRRIQSDWNWQETAVQGIHVCIRSWLELARDRQGLLIIAAQPLILAAIVVVSQHAQAESAFVHFFLVVSAIWLGMTLTVRELVRERHAFVRDHYAGLEIWAYLGGKFTAWLPPMSCQVIMLYIFGRILMHVFVSNELHGVTREDLLGASAGKALFILFTSGVAGLLIGLSISAVARSERSAVALLPLVLLPQMLFSRVSYGHGGEGWGNDSPFAPVSGLWQYFTGNPDPGGVIASLVSLFLVSRPLLVMLDYGDAGFQLLIGDIFLSVALLVAHTLLLLWLFKNWGQSVPLR